MELGHLCPVGLLLNADTRKADDNLRGLAIIIALPGYSSSKGGFNGGLLREQIVEGFLVCVLICLRVANGYLTYLVVLMCLKHVCVHKNQRN